MNQTTWVIQVLDDSNNRSIEYKNRFWLRQNVEKLDIKVYVENCVANVFDVADGWKERHTILIQEGKEIYSGSDFHPGKEALLLLKRKKGYTIFLYSPKE